MEQIFIEKRIFPPRSWENLENHYLIAMSNPWYKALTIIQDEINHSTWRFFRQEGIKSVNLPITTGSVTSPMGLGSDSLPVKIELEGVPTYLADSMQFHLEYAIRILDEGVHYIMPSFRGEQADVRHLCQFNHSEAEILGGLSDVMALINRYIHHLCVDILDHIPHIIENTAGSVDHITSVIDQQANYPTVTFEEAISELKQDPRYVQTYQQGFRTLTYAGEKELIARFGGIVWVTHHDYMSVPFYQAATPDRKYAMNADMLFGIGEVVGCGERHKTGEEVREALKHHNVNAKNYAWYIQMKDLAPVKTAGFGMGIERFILWLTSQNDIRDCQLLPRFNGQLIDP